MKQYSPPRLMMNAGSPCRRRRIGGGGQRRDEPPQQLAAGAPLVDAQQEVGAGVGVGAGAQNPGLDVVQLERDACFGGHEFSPFSVVGCRG